MGEERRCKKAEETVSTKRLRLKLTCCDQASTNGGGRRRGTHRERGEKWERLLPAAAALAAVSSSLLSCSPTHRPRTESRLTTPMSSSFVTLVITHSDLPNFRVEKNFDLSLSVSDLKNRVRCPLIPIFSFSTSHILWSLPNRLPM